MVNSDRTFIAFALVNAFVCAFGILAAVLVEGTILTLLVGTPSVLVAATWLVLAYYTATTEGQGI